jgi:hypothetical protein
MIDATTTEPFDPSGNMKKRPRFLRPHIILPALMLLILATAIGYRLDSDKSAKTLPASSISENSTSTAPKPQTPAPTAAHVGWIINTSAISKLTSAGATSTLINTAFNTADAYVTGNDPAIGVPTVDYASYQGITSAFTNGSLPGKYKALIYDNEHWQFTPVNEQVDPIYYEQLAANLAHAHGMLYVATPATDLVAATGTLVNNNEADTYLARNIAGNTARYADVIDIQAQNLETNLGNFVHFVTTAAGQARLANPKVKVYVGLTTNPSGQQLTGSQLFTPYSAVTSYADGYWLNIPQAGAYCPKCGTANPAAGLYLLQSVYGK